MSIEFRQLRYDGTATGDAVLRVDKSMDTHKFGAWPLSIPYFKQLPPVIGNALLRHAF